MGEEWSKYYTQEEIKRIQQIELESLGVFAKVCGQLGISFYLYGGSMLGAVKYQGFVPWDDDLDVALKRDDYEKLICEGPILLPEKYELQHPKINKYSPYPYIKFRRKDTALIEYRFRKTKINQGVYFDIYPIDNISDDDNEVEIERKKVLWWIKVLQCKQTCSIDRPVKSIKDILRQVLAVLKHYAFTLIPKSLIICRLDKIMTKHNGKPTLRQGNLFYPKPVNFFDGIEPSVLVNFEGMALRIPKGYKVNLENRYGDISVLPPESERVGHRPYMVKLN